MEIKRPSLNSFGFRFLKSDAKLRFLSDFISTENIKIYDVRNLFDPFYIAGDKTGLDQDVMELVFEKGGSKIVEQILQDINSNPNIDQIWVGCKGGRHRSVAICEILTSKLENFKPVNHHHINL